MSTTNTMSKLKFSLEALVSTVGSRATKGVLIVVIDDKNVQGLYTYKKLKKVTDNWIFCKHWVFISVFESTRNKITWSAKT